MSGGPPRRGYGRSSGRSSAGTTTPIAGSGGSRRPGRGGNNDNVLPLITGVLGSSILAFSLYVLAHKPGVFGTDRDHPTVMGPVCCEPGASGADSCYDVEGQPCMVHADPNRIKMERRKFQTFEDEAIIKERQDKSQYRSKLQRQLKQHLRKVKEITDELEKDEQAKKRNWPRESWWSNVDDDD